MKIKGHAKIELTDVTTGKKEVIEHYNIITNAVQNLLEKWIEIWGISNINSYVLPLIKKAMGGIYIFNNTLTENVDNIYLPNPTIAALTGYAGNCTSDGNDTMRGDLNANESGEITNGYKFVYDFGTDDANGEIAALALTSDIAGYHGYHYNPRLAIEMSNSYQSNDYSAYKGLGSGVPATLGSGFVYLVKIDYDNNKFICIQKTSQTNINIITYSCEYTKIMLNSKLNTIVQESVESITISDTVMTETSPCWIDGGDGYYYGVYGYNNGANYVIKICKISQTDYTYTEAVATTISNVNMPTIRCINNNMGQDSIEPKIRNGYIYTYTGANYGNATSNTYSIIKIDITNPLNYTIIENSQYTAFNDTYGNSWFIYKLPNNIIVTNGFVIGNDDTLYSNNQKYGMGNGIYLFGQYSSHCYVHNDKLFTIVYGAGYNNTNKKIWLYPNLQYLATINNLDSPVTKTAAKTMKITYTLTYAAE